MGGSCLPSTSLLPGSFSNLGIQCVKKKEIEAAIEKKLQLGIDPFKGLGRGRLKQSHSGGLRPYRCGGIQIPCGAVPRPCPVGPLTVPSPLPAAGSLKNHQEVDMNVVRICFQATYKDGSGQTRHLSPVLSEPIFDKSMWWWWWGGSWPWWGHQTPQNPPWSEMGWVVRLQQPVPRRSLAQAAGFGQGWSPVAGEGLSPVPRVGCSPASHGVGPLLEGWLGRDDADGDVPGALVVVLLSRCGAWAVWEPPRRFAA